MKRLKDYIRREEIKLTVLEKQLIKHEGFVPSYHFVNNVLHFGAGHNCEDNPLTKKQDETVRYCSFEPRTRLALELLEQDIKVAESGFYRAFPSIFTLFTKEQKNSLIMMVFQMGIGSFAGSKKLKKRGFKKTIAFINAGKWEEAKEEAKDSVWYRKYKRRAEKVLEGFTN